MASLSVSNSLSCHGNILIGYYIGAILIFIYLSIVEDFGKNYNDLDEICYRRSFDLASSNDFE